MCQLLKAIVGQVKVVHVATARDVFACDSCAAIVILQARAVVCDMDEDRVVWRACQIQGLQHTGLCLEPNEYS